MTIIDLIRATAEYVKSVFPADVVRVEPARQNTQMGDVQILLESIQVDPLLHPREKHIAKIQIAYYNRSILACSTFIATVGSIIPQLKVGDHIFSPIDAYSELIQDYGLTRLTFQYEVEGTKDQWNPEQVIPMEVLNIDIFKDYIDSDTVVSYVAPPFGTGGK